MHVIYFHQHFSTPKGSAGIRSYEMARRLIAEGHSVTMVCGSYGAGKTGIEGPFKFGQRRGVIDCIDVIEFDLSYSNKDGFLKRSWIFSKYALGSAWIALTERYDLAFATTTPLTAGIPGLVARWLRWKPFIFEVRDLWPELPRAMGVIKNRGVLGLLGALEWASYRSADRCVALSPGILDGIARRGVPREAIALIPNGCDLGIFNVPQTPWRPEGVTHENLMAIFTGTHGLANGLDAILDAAAVLKTRGNSNIRLVLVGDGKLKPALMARADEEGLNNVIFHPLVDKAKLAGLMAAADVGIQCLANVPAFYFGTSPNKFFDYIAAGIPVINNYPGWLAQMISENACGFAVPPDSPTALADALEQADNDRSRLKTLGRNALALAQSQFDRNRLADRWVKWVVGEKSR